MLAYWPHPYPMVQSLEMGFLEIITLSKCFDFLTAYCYTIELLHSIVKVNNY